MTDEEKQAEEYIINKYYRDWLEEESRDVILEDVYAHDKNELQAFQDGAKWGMEHSIEWHDLRKDPNDFPKVKGYYLIAQKNCPICTLSYFNHSEMEFNDNVIAWCELPQFKDKE